MRLLSVDECMAVAGGWQDDPAELSEVIVNGVRWRYYVMYPQLPPPWIPSSPPSSGGGGGPPAPPPPMPPTENPCHEFGYDPDSVTTEWTAEENATLDRLQNVIVPQASHLLNQIRADASFTYMGFTMTGAELHNLFNRVDWQFTRGVDTGNGGFGAADRNGGDPVLSINTDELADQIVGDRGIFYVLHELAHTTQAGYAFWTAQRAAWEQAGGSTFPDSNFHALNERFVNNFARAIAVAAGLPLNEFVTNDFAFDEPNPIVIDLGVAPLTNATNASAGCGRNNGLPPASGGGGLPPGGGGGGGTGGGYGDIPYYVEP